MCFNHVVQSGKFEILIPKMTSYEPDRTKHYDNDLRWRMVYQREVLGYTYTLIAKNLGVDTSTVQRVITRFQATGTVTKSPYPRDRACKKLTAPVQLLILNFIVEQSHAYLSEVQKHVKNFLQLDLSITTICKFLHQQGFSRQKLQKVALQQDRLKREQFIIDASVYSQDMLIFVDETGADQRDTLRKYGYSLRGKTPSKRDLLVRGERVSAIACMSTSGLLDVKIVRGTTNGDYFYDFVQTHLLPHTMPFNGVNPHSVVILDNCAIHHVNEVVHSIENVGTLVHFLPPYSPDFNPIEELFSKVKYNLKKCEDEMPHITDVETLLLASFAMVTENDCRGWINHQYA